MITFEQLLTLLGLVRNIQIGQALRILQVHGYHTDLSTRFPNEQELVRCQHIWWTVYILERQISVLMGTPLSISDNDINTPLPLFPDSPLKTTTLLIHVKLSKAFSRIVNGTSDGCSVEDKISSNSKAALYRDAGEMESTFVKSTQEVLQRVADVACELRENFPVPDQGALSGISRVSGYLNLLYHQVSFHSVPKLLTSNTISVYHARYSAVFVHSG